MFIINPIKKEEATGELQALYAMIEKVLGFVPPHFELFATLDATAMRHFMALNQYMMTHAKIQKELLPFLRLYIANKECRSYCTNFNTQMLLKMGIDEKIIANIEKKIEEIPLETAQKMLLLKVIKALYEPQAFCKEDLDALYAQGFSNKDFFDLLSYASEFSAKSKMIEVYLESSSMLK